MKRSKIVQKLANFNFIPSCLKESFRTPLPATVLIFGLSCAFGKVPITSCTSFLVDDFGSGDGSIGGGVENTGWAGSWVGFVLLKKSLFFCEGIRSFSRKRSSSSSSNIRPALKNHMSIQIISNALGLILMKFCSKSYFHKAVTHLQRLAENHHHYHHLLEQEAQMN